MAKSKKQQAVAKTKEKGKAEKSALSFHQKMHLASKENTKALGASLMNLEPPKGTNGAVPTNCLCVDLITGGGFPRWRMTTVSGDRGAGKTTLIQKSMGPQLAKGVLTTYADLEGAADYTWFMRNGCDMNKFIKEKMLDYIADFSTGDDAFRYFSRQLDAAIEAGSGQMKELAMLLYYDSIPAGPPEAVLDNDEAGNAPHLAQMLSKYLPLIRARLRKSNSLIVLINQIRENPRAQFGSPEYEPGGNAPDFYADMKIWLRRVGKAKDITLKKDHPITPKDTAFFKAGGVNIEVNPDGSEDRYVYTHVKTEKNRVFSPLKETYFRVWIADQSGQGQGIDPVFDTLRFYEEIGWCKFISRSEVWLKRSQNDRMKEYDYFDLKAEILTDSTLTENGAKLLNMGAFTDYFERIKNNGQEWVAPTAEEDSQEEINKETGEITMKSEGKRKSAQPEA